MAKKATETKIEYFKTSEIKPYDKNPRNNDDAVAAVAASIKEFGFKQPIVVDKNNIIVAGHTRWKAALDLNLEKVPVIRADDLTEEQVKAYRLADNKVGELANWDFGLLSEELDGILDIDMSDFGFEDLSDFDTSNLDNLFTDAPEKEKEPKKIQCPHCGEWFEA